MNFRKFLLPVVAALVLAGCSQTDPQYAQKDALAQCLTQKGVIMYGLATCPHCRAQKEMFGKAFADVTYVECSTDQMKCQLAGVPGYPARSIPGQSGLVLGTTDLATLAQDAQCVYTGTSAAADGSTTAAE